MGRSRAGVTTGPSLVADHQFAEPGPLSVHEAVHGRAFCCLLVATRWRFHSRPVADRRQQREHRGAVRVLRAWRPQSGQSGSSGSRPALRSRRRR